MNWVGVGPEGPLVVIRAIHFAATAATAGTLVFRAVVAEPALRSGQLVSTKVEKRVLRVAWSSFVLAAVTGAMWFHLQAVSMSGLPFSEAITPGVLSVVLNETQFGRVSEIRLLLVIILGASLAFDRPGLPRWVAIGAALGLIATIAWTGHAGSTLGSLGILHLSADALHLCMAAAWIGGLLPLVALLAACKREQALQWEVVARTAAQRFSLLGMVSVATLLVTGTVNSWILVGSFHMLLITEYGRLLMFKIGLFVFMLAFAAANRFWLTPQLAPSSAREGQPRALRQLTNNSIAEIILGFAIFAIVGMLGTMHPAAHGL